MTAPDIRMPWINYLRAVLMAGAAVAALGVGAFLLPQLTFNVRLCVASPDATGAYNCSPLPALFWLHGDQRDTPRG